MGIFVGYFLLLDNVTSNGSNTLRPSHCPQKHTLLIVQYSKVAPKDVVHAHTRFWMVLPNRNKIAV